MPESESHTCSCWEPWWNGEPTVLAFLKATEDAIAWMNDDTSSTKIGYGIYRLIQQAEEFLEGWQTHIFDGCELCEAERQLKTNIATLREIMRP